VELTRERKLPFVTLDFGFDDDTIASVGVDDVEGGRMAARHLAELGHRRFAVLSLAFTEDGFGPATIARAQDAIYSGTRDRINGYMEVLAAQGIDTSAVPIFETKNDEATTVKALEHFFALSAPPTAILAMSDRVALVALKWLAAHGLSVPGDVSIVGFDGVPEGETSEPPLTSVAQPMAELGRRAVRGILGFDGAIHRETLPLELIVRRSTGAPQA